MPTSRPTRLHFEQASHGFRVSAHSHEVRVFEEESVGPFMAAGNPRCLQQQFS
jgi:hypothetical protein